MDSKKAIDIALSIVLGVLLVLDVIFGTDWNNPWIIILIIISIIVGIILIGHFTCYSIVKARGKNLENLEVNVHSTLKWTIWKGNARYAQPTRKFWRLWGNYKDELKTLGIFVEKSEGKWVVKQYSS